MEWIGWFKDFIGYGKTFFDFINRKKKISQLNILFIDDEHEELDIIKTLFQSKEYGSVNSLSDLDNLDNLYLKAADMIFLNVQGVGKKMTLGNGTLLVDRIKSKYPDKIITMYSSKGLPKNSNIREGVSIIPKNSSYDIFSSHIKSLWDSKK